MKRLALILLLPLLLASCEKYYNYHYRRVVIVDTPQGQVRGSTVGAIAFRYNSGFTLPDSPRGHTQIAGEATVVDLGDGRYLFVLLGNELGLLVAAHAEALDLEKGSGNSRIKRIYKTLKQQTTPRLVPPKDYPLLVTFEDLSDPASVRRVDPADLAATFGAGYALGGITLEITDAPVAEGEIEGVLGWLPDHRGKVKPTDKRYMKDVLPEERLYKNDFIRIAQ